MNDKSFKEDQNILPYDGMQNNCSELGMQNNCSELLPVKPQRNCF